MIDCTDAAGVITHDNHTHRGSTALEVEFLQLLTLEASQQCRHFMTMLSVDAANCYVHVGRTFLSLACQDMGLHVEEIKVMTHMLDQIKFFLRSGFGDSARFFR